jgi:hypothetical protein
MVETPKDAGAGGLLLRLYAAAGVVLAEVLCEAVKAEHSAVCGSGSLPMHGQQRLLSCDEWTWRPRM